MTSQIDWISVGDVLANHLPALWVVAAAVIGSSAVSALIPETSSVETEVAPGVTAVTPDVIRDFPLEIGTVTRVVDGDTYDVQLNRTGETVRVRLACASRRRSYAPVGAQPRRDGDVSAAASRPSRRGAPPTPL